MIIRRALAQDANELAEFNSSIARETEGIELIPEVIGAGVKAMIENPQMGFYLVVELDNGIQASLMVTTEWSDWRNGNLWWIQSVYVVPSSRGQGIFRRLYEEVTAFAKDDEGVRGIRLYVEKDNHNAQQVYQRLGMSETAYRVFEAYSDSSAVEIIAILRLDHESTCPYWHRP